MPEDPANDIASLAAQIIEQLRFFREIGVTEIRGSTRPASGPSARNESDQFAPHSAGMRTRSADAPGTNGQDLSARDEGKAGPIQDRSAEQQEEEHAPQVNLFGEIASQEAMAKNVKTRISPVETGALSNAPSDRSLEEIRIDLGECTRCRLHEHRTNIVFGEGNPSADLVFVGEGPGAEEDRTGRPFVGRAGQLLDKIIEAMGLRRADVYIANVVKCRPPENRTPERDEAATCGPFLFRQLGIIRPKVIVALGAPALQCLTGSREGITKIRGRWQDWHGIRVMPTYHPAYLLRVPDKKKETWEDIKKVRDYIVKGESYP